MMQKPMRRLRLRLYIAADSPNSVTAKANLKILCSEHGFNCESVEVVDILREPQRCLEDGVLVTPVLVRLAPTPVRMIAGDLSDLQSVVSLLSR